MNGGPAAVKQWHTLATKGWWVRILVLPYLMLSIALAAGCQQKMARQPSYKPLDTCDFFRDDRSARPLVDGVVARGHLRIDTALYAGRRPEASAEAAHAALTKKQEPAKTPAEQVKAAEAALTENFVGEFPFPITAEVLERGRHRFMIYCVVCHDPLGTGQGKIVERGYTQPPSYHIERLRKAPTGYLFAVATEGYGSMPSYAAQVPARDRWAIVAYIRALQESQRFPEKEMTQTMRDEQARQAPVVPREGGSP